MAQKWFWTQNDFELNNFFYSKNIFDPKDIWKKLFTDSVSVNKKYLTDTLSVNKKYLTDSGVPIEKKHGKGGGLLYSGLL